MTRPRQAGGFTLLEIIVALAVLGFLMVALTQGVQFGLRAWDAQARATNLHADLDAVDRTLRELVTEAEPGSAAEPGLFRATPGTLAFTTLLPQIVGGLVTRDADVALGVDRSHRLVLRYVPHPHAERIGPPPGGGEAIMLDGVEHIDFGFWRSTPQGSGWVTTWSAPELPTLVRIRFAFVKGSGRSGWPDIIVAPMRSRLEE